MTTAPVIHIGGWPGAGKKTIARLVADRLGGRLIHNHLLLDAVRSVYDRDHKEGPILREQLRTVLMEHAKRLPSEIAIVLTDALADEPAALPLFQPALDLAQARNVALHSFLLDLSVVENMRRLSDPERGGAKLKDVAVLAHIRSKDVLYTPQGAITLDVTHMSAKEAASAILKKVNMDA